MFSARVSGGNDEGMLSMSDGGAVSGGDGVWEISAATWGV
jgi:hypothetical protein